MLFFFIVDYPALPDTISPCKHGLADHKGPPLRPKMLFIVYKTSRRVAREIRRVDSNDHYSLRAVRYALLIHCSLLSIHYPPGGGSRAPALRTLELFLLVSFNIRRSRIFHSARSAEFHTCKACISLARSANFTASGRRPAAKLCSAFRIPNLPRAAALPVRLLLRIPDSPSSSASLSRFSLRRRYRNLRKIRGISPVLLRRFRLSGLSSTPR